MNRRSFVSTAATSVAAFATLGTAGRNTQTRLVYTSSDWKLSEFHQRAKNPARIKQVYDIILIADRRFAVSYAVAGIRRSDLSRVVSGNPTEYKVLMPEIESAIIVGDKTFTTVQLLCSG
jgi:hypothetical protein